LLGLVVLDGFVQHSVQQGNPLQQNEIVPVISLRICGLSQRGKRFMGQWLHSKINA